MPTAGYHTTSRSGLADKRAAALREASPDFPFEHGEDTYGLADTVPNERGGRDPRVTRQKPPEPRIDDSGRPIPRYESPE